MSSTSNNKPGAHLLHSHHLTMSVAALGISHSARDLFRNSLASRALFEMSPGRLIVPIVCLMLLTTFIQGSTAHAAPPPPFAGLKSDYHGFERYDDTVDGCKTVIVAPKSPAPKRPWIWRAEFFDHRPELDIALLAKGFHLVYIEVGNTFGAPSAMKHWDAFYDELTTKYRLSKRPVLEGLSRGGLYIYNWAAANPTRVSVLYGDNPVCDFKSWPGGKGKGPGSGGDWTKLQQDYGFTSEAEALAYKLNPIDNLKSIARAHIPIIHCAADADEVVPYEENTAVIKDRYEKLGGHIEVIVKHGFQHHPHGLDDPTPIVDFIAKYGKF